MPEDIQELLPNLHCIVCQQSIPEARARRQTSTCSEKCKSRLDAIRAHQRGTKKCPYCLHPSTPEERELYRQWRVERGDVRSANKYNRASGLPPRRAMVRILKKAILLIGEERDKLKAQEPASDRVGEFTSFMNDCESVLQPKPQSE